MIYLMFFIALIGTIVAGLWDLVTTEVPDEISLLLSSLGIFGWFVYGAETGNFSFLISSLLFGSLFLLVGFILYKAGQWGGADAVILAAVFYLLPFLPGIKFFQFTYLINFFIVTAVYMIIYTAVLGIKYKKIRKEFKKDVKNNRVFFYILIFVIILYTILTPFFPFLLRKGILIMFLLVAFFSTFYRYAKIIETKHFVRTIKTKHLKPGDVAHKSKQWIGLTEKEVKKIKNQQKTIKIKEGVRMVPVFFLTLLVTYLFGNLLFLIF